MRLSSKGRYAVMAMVDLAEKSISGPVTLSDIAQRQEISLSYLEQLFARLRRAGLVKSVRGPGGGYRLARTADATYVSDIILAVDEPVQATRCGAGRDAIGCMSNGERCATHNLWARLSDHIHQYLANVSISDVLKSNMSAAAE